MSASRPFMGQQHVAVVVTLMTLLLLLLLSVLSNIHVVDAFLPVSSSSLNRRGPSHASVSRPPPPSTTRTAAISTDQAETQAETTNKDDDPSLSSASSSSSSTSLDAAAAAAAVGNGNPRLTGLAYQLDEGTRKSHSMAQNSAFVTGFFKGIATRQSYQNLLTSLYYVYKAMEEDVLDITDNESIRFLDDAPLRRVKYLQQDLAYFYGIDDWDTAASSSIVPPPTPATQRYVDRIHCISKGDDGDGDDNDDKTYLFLAHQYTRYLGDLFGGQMMGAMATTSLMLPPNEGVQFYKFDDLEMSTSQYVSDWYTRLNSLDLTTQQKEEIVDEANLVFDLNIALLQELEGSPFLAMWTLAMNGLKESVGGWSRNEDGKLYFTFQK